MVTEVLQTGEKNAVPGKALAGMLNLTLRELTRAINRERLNGAPICATTKRGGGYYLAENTTELGNYCKSLKHRENELKKTRQACQRTTQTIANKNKRGE